MALFGRRKKRSAEPQTAMMWLREGATVPDGYSRLVDTPEAGTCIDLYCNVISSATIYMMRNGENGDSRVHDSLSRMVDIAPWRGRTRRMWLDWIVGSMLTRDEAYCLIRTNKGEIAELMPMPGATAFSPDNGQSYSVRWNGVDFDPDGCLCLHMHVDPDYPWRSRGISEQVSRLMNCLALSEETKSSFLSTEYKPNVIVSVNADSDLADPEEREKVKKKLLTSKPGEPLIVSADMMKVETIRPLSLNDLAIRDTITLDRQGVAAAFGVPAFVLGVGQFNQQEYNQFIRSRILPLCAVIEQELTLKLAESNTDYFKFNVNRLYAYDTITMGGLYAALKDRGVVTGNETRSLLDLDPKEGLDELTQLENYIPVELAADQKKLVGGDENA